jgi:hypothetical protein
VQNHKIPRISPRGWSAIPLVLAVVILQISGASTRLEAQSLLSRFRSPQHVVLELENNERVEGTLQQLAVPVEPGGVASLELTSEGVMESHPLLAVRRIYFSPVEQTSIVSDEHVRCFSLGRRESRLPAPPDWFRPNADTSAWKPAVLAHPNYNWLYIPGAAWIWSSKNWYETGDEVCLFRQEFDLKSGQRVVSGELTLTADYAVDSAYLNEQPLNVPAASLVGEKAVFDVTNLLRDGENVLAVRVRNDERAKLNSACLGYRLDVASVPAGSARGGAPGVVALFVNGDVVSGELVSISVRSVDVRTPYAQLALDRDWITMIYLNYEPVGAKQQQEKKGLFQRILGKEGVVRLSGSAAPSHLPFFWRTEPPNPVTRSGIALKNGDFIDARLLDASEGAVAVKPRYGNAINISFGDVKAIYLNPGKAAGTLRYEPEDEQYRGRLRLANGDVVSGLLLEMSGSQVTFRPPYGDATKINAADIASCDLPHHFMKIVADKVREAMPSGAPSVALIGDPYSNRHSKGKEVSEDSLYYRVNRALYELGIDAKWLDAAKMANRQILSPENFRLLINVDENEHYYETYQRPKDVYETIREYVQSGGDFAHFARGTPFYYAYRPIAGRWATVTDGNYLNNAIGLNVASPGEAFSGGEPFELPENKNTRLYFELNRESPFADGLPAEVEFPVTRDSRFRPIRRGELPAGAEFFPLYSLKDSAGKNYGVAMAVVEYAKPPHYAVYTSHLLLDSSYEDVPMVDYLVPHLIALTLSEKR